MSVDNLVLLVGSSPLPNYLAVKMLRPDAVWLVYTPETKRVKDRLVAVLQHQGLVDQVCEESIQDAGDAQEARRVVSRLPKRAHLHYTGGTKPMGVHVYQAWWDRGDVQESQASYLDDRTESLRFDDGTSWLLQDHQFDLDLQTLGDLKGLQNLKIRSQDSSTPRSPTWEDAGILARETLTNRPELPRQLYARVTTSSGRLRTFACLRANPLQLQRDFGLDLSARLVPEPGWSNRQITSWLDFLKGDWLEDWTGQMAESRGLGRIFVGNNAVRHNGRPFETDVAVIRGHRLYLLSCTTDDSPQRCKSKLFEVGHRARHLGGDLSRFALVCLLDERNLTADKLEKDVEDDWASDDDERPTRYPVFAPRHLREWLQGNTGSLVEWLEQ